METVNDFWGPLMGLFWYWFGGTKSHIGLLIVSGKLYVYCWLLWIEWIKDPSEETITGVEEDHKIKITITGVNRWINLL